MKRRSFAAAALAPWVARAETAMGGHGMAVFGGREGLYASHLPMFHAPHDSQVVLRFHLAEPPADRGLRERLARKPGLWTLDPEPFDLLRLAPGHAEPLRDFKASVFAGHFERGGVLHATAQWVVVDEVLLFRRLDPQPRESGFGQYRVLGRGREWFAVKEIDRRPDFDHIARLSGPAQAARARVALSGLNPPGPELARALGVASTQTLYFETDDLR